MQIYVIRHGETEANVKGIFQGNTDFPLNENGIKLARLTGQALKGVKFQKCFSSPLLRAAQTAEAVLEESGNTACPIIYDDRLREIQFGEWEGKKMRHGECEVPEEDVRLFFRDPFRLPAFPGGEDVYQVCNRTQSFLQKLAANEEEGTFLVATHGCAFRAMLNFLYDDPADFWHGGVPYNCAVSILEVRGHHISLLYENRIYYDRAMIVDRYGNMT